jgi:hypothetical protein
VCKLDPRCATTVPKYDVIRHNPSIWLYAQTFESHNLDVLQAKMSSQADVRDLLRYYGFPVSDQNIKPTLTGQLDLVIADLKIKLAKQVYRSLYPPKMAMGKAKAKVTTKVYCPNCSCQDCSGLRMKSSA